MAFWQLNKVGNSAFALGKIYHKGKRVPQDYKKAFEFFKGQKGSYKNI